MSTLKVDNITGDTAGSPNFPDGILLNGSQVYARSNILGTVSQTDGVPTGAIIERGSNANGDFVRFADGTQICTIIPSFANTSTALGNIFWTSADVTVTWPAAFSSIPAHYGCRISELTYAIWLVSGAVSATTATAFVGRLASSTTSTTSRAIRVTAIGRWYEV